MNKKKATALLEQAKLHLSLGQHEKAEAVIKEVAYEADLRSSVLFAVLADAQSGQDRTAEAIGTLEEGLRRFPRDADLEARMGQALLEQDRVEEALERFARAREKLGRDPSFLTQHAFALIRGGRLDQAESALTTALGRGAGAEAKLVLAVARGKRGLYSEAEEMAARIEEASKSVRLTAAARALRADCRLFMGDAKGALELWKVLRAEGQLDDGQLGHMAYAAELSGESALCDELSKERLEGTPTSEDLLLFAQIANLRGDGEEAQRRLEASEEAPGERHPGHGFEVLATKGRALRLTMRRGEARAALEEAAAMPEFQSARLGPKVHIDLGHLAAEEGDFDRAADRFKAALAMDAEDPEAKRALSLTERRVAWRAEVEASAEAKVEAAKAEAAAMRRRFQVREGELEALRRELERVKAAQREAEEKARKAEEEARKAEEEARRAAEEGRAAQEQKVKEELLAREREWEEKAAENVDRALGEAALSCPLPLRNLLMVAEKTYQTALYTELPAAAVAVLYSGALERALFVWFVERFDRWLSEGGRRGPFLSGAVRERRGKRVEYFDHFVEAFDHERAGRAPSMGEVGRVLSKRNEPYLKPFRDFLEESHKLPDGFYDELASFVQWSKERLRDPAAHGRGIEMGYDELKRFREQLLFSFGAHGKGVLRMLMG